MAALTFASSARGDTVSWKAAADGDWSAAANWSPEQVPTAADKVKIVQDANAYTVTVSSAQTVQDLTVSGVTSRAYQTRIDVKAPLTIDGGLMTARYADIHVGPGGVLELKNETSGNSSIRRLGRLVIDGGTFVRTNNITQTMYLAGETWENAGSYASFTMNSGNAYFKGSKTLLQGSAGTYSQEIVLHGGRMEFIDTSANHNATLLSLESKSISQNILTMDGDAEILLSKGGNVALGRGIATIGGNAKLTVNSSGDTNYLFLGPNTSDSGVESTLNIQDNASLTAGGLRGAVFGKSDLRVKRLKGYFNMSGGTYTTGYKTDLGTGSGIWETTLTGGTMKFTLYGLHIGGVPIAANYQTYANSLLSCTSTVTIAGGTFDCEAANAHGPTPSKSMWGMVLGYGLVGNQYASLTNGWTDARLVLKDTGTLKRGACPFLIGVGKAVASFRQEGGSFTADCVQSDASCPRDALVIGSFGGKGTYEMSGGTATLACPLYVGGTTLGKLQRMDPDHLIPTNGMDKAEGTLKISGGTMSYARHGVVGLDGRGTIEMSGTGSLAIAEFLTLTNSAAVGCSATLKFVLTGDTAPTIKVNGPLVVEAGSKLVVDATGYTGTGRVKLVDCTARNGDFAPADITFVNTNPLLSLEQTADGSICLVRKGGCAIILR